MKMRGRLLFKTISLDGIKPNANPKTNPYPNTNPNTNTNPIQSFYAFFEHRLLIFSLALFQLFRLLIGDAFLDIQHPISGSFHI